MAQIGSWDSTMPSGTSQISDGDDLLRDHWAVIEGTFEEEHYFKDGQPSGQSAGKHKQGSALPYVGTESEVSSGDEGRLMYTTDTEKFHVVSGSTSTVVGLAPQLAKMAVGLGSVLTQSSYNTVSWSTVVYDVGGFTTFASNTTGFEIPITGYYNINWQLKGTGGIQANSFVMEENSGETLAQGADGSAAIAAHNGHLTSYLTSGDTVYLLVQELAGGGNKLLSSVTVQNYMEIRRVG